MRLSSQSNRPKATKKKNKEPTVEFVRKALNPEETERIGASLEIIVSAVESLRWSAEHSSSRERATVLPLRTPDDESIDQERDAPPRQRPVPDERPDEKTVKSVLLDIKSFVINSPKLRESIGNTTKVIPTVLAFIDSLHEVIVRDWQRKRELPSAKKKKGKDSSDLGTPRSSSRRKSLKNGRSTPKRNSNSSSATSNSQSRYMLILVRALEILEQLTQTNSQCADQLVKENPRSLDILVRIFGGVRQYTTTWEGMLVLGRVAGVLLSVVSLDDSGRRRFFEAKGGAALLLAVDLVCAVARARKPEPILRGGFDVGGDAWVQLATSVCTLIVEASASDKLINHSNVRALHSAGVFDALCRLLAALMRKQRSGSKSHDATTTQTTTGSSDHSDSERENGYGKSVPPSGTSFPLLHTPYAKKLILALHALVSGQRDHQRSFLQVTSRPRGHNEHTLLVYPLVRELNRAWVTSWLGATSPEIDPEDGVTDMYWRYARQWSLDNSTMNGGGGGDNEDNVPTISDTETWEAETKRVRNIASEAYELYACIQLLLAALQFEFDDGTEEVRRALARCSLEKTVHEVAADVGGSAVYSLRVIHNSILENEDVPSGISNSTASTTTTSTTTKDSTDSTNPTEPTDPSNATNATNATQITHNAEPITSQIIELASGVSLPPCDAAVQRCARWYSIVMDECRDLHLYHYDDVTCVEALDILGKTLRNAGSEGQHIFVNVHGAVDQLIRNINQIDENVMRAACSATSSLLHGSPMAQRMFLKHGGLNALSDCLCDYDVAIRGLALRSILIMIKGSRVSMSINSSNNGNDRYTTRVVEDVRKCGILDHCLNILSEFIVASTKPCEKEDIGGTKRSRKYDSDMVDVAMQSASVLSYCVDDNVTNQQHVSTRGGMSTLRDVLRLCLAWKTSTMERKKRKERSNGSNSSSGGNSGNGGNGKEEDTEDKDERDHHHHTETNSNNNKSSAASINNDPSDPNGSCYKYSHAFRYEPMGMSELTENVSGALSNLAFRNQPNQDEMRRNGTLALCVSALCGRVGIEFDFNGLHSVTELLEQRKNQKRQNHRERRERRERRRERRSQGVSSSCTGGSSYSDNTSMGEGTDGYDDQGETSFNTQQQMKEKEESNDPLFGVTRHARLPCRPLALTTSILNIVVNAVDANPMNQVAIGTSEVAHLLTSLMGHGGPTADDRLPLFDEDMNDRDRAVWTSHPTPLSLVVGMQKVSAMACLLASHMAWDNIVNQMHFGTLERVAQLLCLVETGSMFGNLLRTTVKGQTILSKLPLTQYDEYDGHGYRRDRDEHERDMNHGNDYIHETKKTEDPTTNSMNLPLSSQQNDTNSSNISGNGDVNINTGNTSTTTASSTNVSNASNSNTTDQLLAAEDPTGRDGIQYLQGGGVGDPMMDQNQTSLGIFSVDELGNGGSEEEVQLYALMALINMSYHNLAVHNLVHQAGGVETILHLLGSSAFDVRKAAIFCLGNVVTGHKVKFFCIYKKKTPFLFRSNFFYFYF